MPCPEQEDNDKTDNAPLLLTFLWKLSTLQLKDNLARQVQEQLGLQPGDPRTRKTSGFQWRGWVSVRETQPPTPLTVGDAPKESRLPVTGNGLQNNRDELLGDNGTQKAPSIPKGEKPKE